MYNNHNFDGMVEVLECRIEDIKTKMGGIYALVNNHVERHAFEDIINTTINVANIRNGRRRGR